MLTFTSYLCQQTVSFLQSSLYPTNTDSHKTEQSSRTCVTSTSHPPITKREKRKRTIVVHEDEQRWLQTEGFAEYRAKIFALAHKDFIHDEARVDIKSLRIGSDNPLEQLVCILGEVFGWSWVPRGTKTAVGGTNGHEYVFDCSLSTMKPKRAKIDVRDASKPLQGTRRYGRCLCHGTITIRTLDSSFNDTSFVVDVTIHHENKHPKYGSEELTPEAIAYIQRNPALEPSILLQELKKQTPQHAYLQYTIRSIKAYIQKFHKQRWHYDKDSLISTRRLISEREKQTVEPLDMEWPTGSEGLAFVFKQFVDGWAGRTSSFLTDSTYETNKDNFELFVGMADMQGAGLPLSYLVLRLEPNAPPKTKELVLNRWYTCLKTLGIDPQFTLSDKDQSEINALRAVWPGAKHQLCFWHALKALTRRLRARRRPKAYNPNEAIQRFPLIKISKAFVPVGKTNLPIPPPPPPCPIIILENEQSLSHSTYASRSALWQSSDVDDTHSMVAQATRFIMDEDNRQNIADNPQSGQHRSLTSDSPETLLDFDDLDGNSPFTTPSNDYIFCPKPHRNEIVKIFTLHFCQHPLLLEKNGQPLTADQIYEKAVDQMYRHCYRNNLLEVWAYLWNCWYSPSMFPLWARSAYPTAIPQRRNTAVVEASWSTLKRIDLRKHNAPRLDLMVHTIIEDTFPRYKDKFNRILAKANGQVTDLRLSDEQATYKKAWAKLSELPLNDGSYTINIGAWVCNCGNQMLHTYLLCKHLVQAVGTPSPEWWSTVVRRDSLPFYDVSTFFKIQDPLPPKIDWEKPYYWRKADAPSEPSLSNITTEDGESNTPFQMTGSLFPPINYVPSPSVQSKRANKGTEDEIQTVNKQAKQKPPKVEFSGLNKVVMKMNKFNRNYENSFNRKTPPRKNTSSTGEVDPKNGFGAKYPSEQI